MSFTDLYKGEN